MVISYDVVYFGQEGVEEFVCVCVCVPVCVCVLGERGSGGGGRVVDKDNRQSKTTHYSHLLSCPL